MGETTAAVGIPWYRRRDYAEILSIMSDGRHLPTSYDRWRLRAEDLEQRVRANGRETVRAVIEPREFRRWCAVNRHRSDAPARLAFIEYSLRRTGESRGG